MAAKRSFRDYPPSASSSSSETKVEEEAQQEEEEQEEEEKERPAEQKKRGAEEMVSNGEAASKRVKTGSKVRGSAENPLQEKTGVSRRLEGQEESSVSALSRWFMKGIEDLGGGVGTITEEFIRKGTGLIDERKRAELCQRWRSLQEQEMQLAADRARVIGELVSYLSDL
ncbi:hypothetical protein CRG98_031771 [Punica granatum]|uniref:Uncharacterized protein n=1 Tax=Punica granatum TaxID=22663 RepID=A0A2I0IVZ8_PUNGR|nr:hypothetical protein CRG98_031771 [Punica granatum]